jgi:hypothetical protein
MPRPLYPTRKESPIPIGQKDEWAPEADATAGIEPRSSSPYPSHYSNWATTSSCALHLILLGLLNQGWVAVMFEVEVFWVVILQGVTTKITSTWNFTAVKSSNSASQPTIPLLEPSPPWMPQIRRHNPEDLDLKPHHREILKFGVTTHNTSTRTFTAVNNSNSASQPRRPRLQTSPPWRLQIRRHNPEYRNLNLHRR